MRIQKKNPPACNTSTGVGPCLLFTLIWVEFVKLSFEESMFDNSYSFAIPVMASYYIFIKGNNREQIHSLKAKDVLV